MEPVIQEEVTGCAIASAATIAGVSYQQAKESAHELGIHANDPVIWSDPQPVRQLLQRFGFNTAPAEVPFRHWENLPDLALLAIKWHLEQGKPFWHWVVFVRQHTQAVVLDSKKALKHNRRTDFGRIKPKWYIEVLNPPF